MCLWTKRFSLGSTSYTRSHNVWSISELRKLFTKDLLQGSENRDYSLWWVTALSCQYPTIFKPVLDGYVLPEKYVEMLRHAPPSPRNDVPVITGNNKDESGASTTTNYTVAEYKKKKKKPTRLSTATSPRNTSSYTPPTMPRRQTGPGTQLIGTYP